MKNKDIFFAPLIVDTLCLPEEESNHCVRVLRKKEGEELLITDGKGVFYHSSIVESNPKKCKVRINQTEHVVKSWDFNLSIAFAPTKNMDRIEWFVEKATEIGIDNFYPILTQNSERKILKLDRLFKVISSACKQSQKAFYPELYEVSNFKEFLTRDFDGQKLIAHCHDSVRYFLADVYRKSELTLILIGPEGDFTEEEVELAVQNGFIPISLSAERLRTETAALFSCNAIHVLNY